MWIEMYYWVSDTAEIGSRPVRALWIEIFLLHVLLCYLFVEAREGLVD